MLPMATWGMSWAKAMALVPLVVVKATVLPTNSSVR